LGFGERAEKDLEVGGLAIRGGVTALSERGRVSKRCGNKELSRGKLDGQGITNAKREGVWT
jgi:hypothetical protein